MPEVDKEVVDQYWEQVTPTILGPYMMDGYGFPASAGNYRFGIEAQIVEKLIQSVDRNGAALDVGSGMGYWAEEFARSFARVDALEGSSSLYTELEKRCSQHSNMRAFLGDALSFQPDQRYQLIFLGGLLMYLDENDVIVLLRRLRQCLEPGGIILCRESTVREQTFILKGDYTAVYRSVKSYASLFQKCGLALRHNEKNEAYILLQIGCESIDKWKTLVPKPFQVLSWVGHLVYWGLRLGNPWIQNVPRVFKKPFPKLENHFFVLEVAMDSSSDELSVDD
jgi:trans-aconitate methyltransferase